jgi:hypothetical protein
LEQIKNVGSAVTTSDGYVTERLGKIVEDEDLSRYILEACLVCQQIWLFKTGVAAMGTLH